jgi:hypothetical protein
LTIISGGQTGADRAALDFAIARGFEHGGWCPRGRRAEDGTIPVAYRLRETREAEYAVRTRRNVIDADATAVFSMTPATRGGTALTARLAREHDKPLLHLHGEMPVAEAAARLRAFLDAHAVRVLNVAGPRASQEPDVGPFVQDVLAAAFAS